MMNKRTFAAVSAGLLLLTGCSTPALRPGRYITRERGMDEFAVVYNDLIFVRVKAPQTLAQSKDDYWEWAGKYKLLEGGEIELDMDSETERTWKFFFNFLNRRGGITLNDVGENKGYLMRYETPVRKKAAAAPVNEYEAQ